ncbi:MAG: BON domain-containing protein [Pseudomonadales bacterium]
MTRATSLLLLLCLLFSCYGCSSLVAATRSGPIEDDYGKRSLGSFIDDSFIETKAKVNLKKADRQLAKAHISVISFNGVALLVGQVPSTKLKQRAGEVVGKIRGVKRVHNELTEAGPLSVPARSNDTWLTTKVKSKLLVARNIKANRIKVVTENGVVYLLGLVSRDLGDRIVAAVRNTFGVQKIVRIFEYIE